MHYSRNEPHPGPPYTYSLPHKPLPGQAAIPYQFVKPSLARAKPHFVQKQQFTGITPMG